MENNEITPIEPEDWDFEDGICQKCGNKVCKCKKKKLATVFSCSIGNPWNGVK
jgi:hypothetical protein